MFLFCSHCESFVDPHVARLQRVRQCHLFDSSRHAGVTIKAQSDEVKWPTMPKSPCSRHD